MRRLPVLPTFVVAVAVAVMIGLGVWQLQRAAWKERLLADYAAAASQPTVDLDPLLARGGPLPQLSFRRVLVTCDTRPTQPEIRTGRSASNVPGQVYLVPCRPNAEGDASRLRINAGWSARPGAVERLTLSGVVAGWLSVVDEGGPIMLTATTASPPLARSASATIESIPNNHLGYAFTWFFFAAAALVIYVMAFRSHPARELPPEP